jgi:hypothetical protein
MEEDQTIFAILVLLSVISCFLPWLTAKIVLARSVNYELRYQYIIPLGVRYSARATSHSSTMLNTVQSALDVRRLLVHEMLHSFLTISLVRASVRKNQSDQNLEIVSWVTLLGR